MIQLIIKHTIQNYHQTHDPKVREQYSILGGLLGIICNILLFILKLAIGTITHSMAIVSDAFNNLSDMFTSFISIISAKLSNKPPDENHPFGHGRFEYLASLTVATIILSVGFSLCETSFHKFFLPITLTTSYISFLILLFSIGIKLWMYQYNLYISKTIHSSVHKATATDSLNDVIATGVVCISTFLQPYTTLPLDALTGMLLGLLIMYTGFSTAKDIINILLGKAASPQLLQEITDCALSSPYITGIHDIRVHDYGPGRIFASFHAEIPDTTDLPEAHAALDNLEDDLRNQYHMEVNIHVDPLCTNDKIITRVRHTLDQIIQSQFPHYESHHLRITAGMTRLNIICDLYVPPHELEKTPLSTILDTLNKAIKQQNPHYHVYISTVYELPKGPKSKVLSGPFLPS